MIIVTGSLVFDYIMNFYFNFSLSKMKFDYKFPFYLDYIKEGLTISDFIASYPWVKRKDVEKALEEIQKREFTSQYAF